MLAVVDLETTGFGKADRIVEIGVVWVTVDGEVVDSFESLINPMRDVGPTSVHGITASMVSAAPLFDEIAGHIGQRLNGCVLVGHNLSFDSRFLSQEYGRLGAELIPGVGICTLRATGERLDVACDRFGIERGLDHSAASDALATAKLMFQSLDVASQLVEPAGIVGEFHQQGFRSLTRAAVGGTATYSSTVLASRNAALPSTGGAELDYLEMLDRALLDAYISEDEAEVLREQASMLGLSAEAVSDLHAYYLQQLIEAVQRDGVVTTEEFELMEKVASALALDHTHLPSVSEGRPSDATLHPGMTVCFTGEAVSAEGWPIERSELEEMAEVAGLLTVSTVSKKKCDALVASDPNSSSGKAAKARQWDKPIFSVEEFLAFARRA